MNTLALSPLMRHSVGFDRFNQMVDALTKIDESQTSYPPYNIEKTSENSYQITMAVAGFSQDDLNIVQERDSLTIRGEITARDEEKNREYLHKGIATRSFERKFKLADHVRVVDAALEHGLLSIALEREIPEAEKPRVIDITSSGKSGKLLGKK